MASAQLQAELLPLISEIPKEAIAKFGNPTIYD